MREITAASRDWSRREWLGVMGGALALARPARSLPSSPVAVARCSSYEPRELLPVLERMFNQLGGLGGLVRGKTVAIKVNLTGGAETRLGHTPAELAHWTHPNVIGAVVSLLAKAGARRIRILESIAYSPEPLEEFMIAAGWEPAEILRAAPRVEFENTSYLGSGKEYVLLQVPGRPHIFPGFLLNHSYADCDVFVSLAKLKEHYTTGITLSMKNSFGITPTTIYGEAAGEKEPALIPRGGRRMLHTGYRQPAPPAPAEIDPASPRDDGYRVPRIVADLTAARPIHLAVIDGITTMTAGEGPWVRPRGGRKLAVVHPRVLIAGLNPVCTDAVATAIMGFDPAAERGTPPFEHCDSTLRLAAAHGIGTYRLEEIEVLGERIESVRFPFRETPTPASLSRRAGSASHWSRG